MDRTLGSAAASAWSSVSAARACGRVEERGRVVQRRDDDLCRQARLARAGGGHQVVGLLRVQPGHPEGVLELLAEGARGAHDDDGDDEPRSDHRPRAASAEPAEAIQALRHHRWSSRSWAHQRPLTSIHRDGGPRARHRPAGRTSSRPMTGDTPGSFGRCAIARVAYAGGVMGDVVRSAVDRASGSDPPARVWRDWVLVAAVVCAAVLESLLRQDIPWRPVSLRGGRRAGVRAAQAAHRPAREVAARLRGRHPGGHRLDPGRLRVNSRPRRDRVPPAPAVRLFRWGSGREAVVGSGFVLIAYGVGLVRDPTSRRRRRSIGSLSSCVPGRPRCVGPLLVDSHDARARPGPAPRARAACARAARHGGAPRLSDGDPSAGRTRRRRVPARRRGRRARGHRGGGLPHSGGDADHGRLRCANATTPT